MTQAAKTATTKTADTPTFTLAVPLPLTDFGAYTIASLLHFDTAYGVNLKILPSTGGNTANLVASGQADAASFTAATAITISQQGKQTSTFWLNEYQPGIALVGAPNIKSIADLKQANNCRIAGPPPGSSTYSSALIYIRENTLKNCTLVQTPTQAAQVNGTVAGAYQATVLGFSGAAQVVGAGGNWLIDPRTAAFTKTYGRSTFPSGMVFGLKSQLQSKPAAVVSFLRATIAADNYMNTHTNKHLVALLQKDSAFATQSADALELGLLHAALARRERSPGYGQRRPADSGEMEAGARRGEPLRDLDLRPDRPPGAVRSGSRRVVLQDRVPAYRADRCQDTTPLPSSRRSTSGQRASGRRCLRPRSRGSTRSTSRRRAFRTPGSKPARSSGGSDRRGLSAH